MRSGSNRSPRSVTIAIVPTRSGTPRMRTRRSRTACRVLERCVGDEHVHVRARQGQLRAGMRPEAQGDQQLRRRRESRFAATTTTGRSAATAALTVTNAVRPRRRASSGRAAASAARPARSISCWPAHAVTPVDRGLAHDEQRRDEDDDRSPNPARLCLEREDAGAHSASAAPRATTSTGSRPQTKRTTIAAMIAKVIAMSVTADRPAAGGRSELDRVAGPERQSEQEPERRRGRSRRPR